MRVELRVEARHDLIEGALFYEEQPGAWFNSKVGDACRVSLFWSHPAGATHDGWKCNPGLNRAQPGSRNAT